MVSEEEGQLSRFTAIFAGGTLFSRVLGMVRDIVLAALVPTASLDAFIVAFRLPNMLRDLVGEGAMNAAFVPVFSQKLETESEEAFRKLVSATMSAMLLILGLLTMLGVIFVPVLLQGINALRVVTGAEARSEESIELVVTLGRWTFPYLFFIGMTVFAMGPLFTVRHYATPSWSPALLNVALIGCCLVFYKYFEGALPDLAYALVIGVWLGGAGQLVVQFLALGRKTGVWLPNFQLGCPGVSEILLLMGPVILGQAAGEVNKVVDSFFGYSLGAGIVVALSYANHLVQLPLSVFGVATAAAILPTVSAWAARRDFEEIRKTILFGIRQTCFFVIPAALGLIILGRPIVWLLFERGEFSREIADRTAVALAIYAVGLVSFCLVKVLVTGFFGMKDTKTPVLVSSLSMVLNIVLNCLLVRPLGYGGLALATTISFTVNFVVLYEMLSNRIGRLWDAALITTLIRILVASGMTVAAAHVGYVRLHALFPGDSLSARILCVGGPVLGAALLYLVFCFILDIREVRYFTRIFRRPSD